MSARRRCASRPRAPYPHESAPRGPARLPLRAAGAPVRARAVRTRSRHGAAGQRPRTRTRAWQPRGRPRAHLARAAAAPMRGRGRTHPAFPARARGGRAKLTRMSELAALKGVIDAAFEQRAQLTPGNMSDDLDDAIAES